MESRFRPVRAVKLWLDGLRGRFARRHSHPRVLTQI